MEKNNMAWSGQDAELTQWSPRNYMYDNFCFIQTELSEDTCHHLIADLAKFVLSDENKGKTLNFFIDSPGGVATTMNQISGLIMVAKLREIKVITWVLGHAASSASLIAVQGDERFMSRNATHFVHFGFIPNFLTKSTEIEKSYKQNQEWHNRIKAIYLKNCKNLTEEKLNKLMEDEFGTINGDECLELGFCDHVIDSDLDELLSQKEQLDIIADEFEQWKTEKEKSEKKSKKNSSTKKVNSDKSLKIKKK
jgi:ATP-dependent protease ClpP protease subunit